MAYSWKDIDPILGGVYTIKNSDVDNMVEDANYIIESLNTNPGYSTVGCPSNDFLKKCESYTSLSTISNTLSEYEEIEAGDLKFIKDSLDGIGSQAYCTAAFYPNFSADRSSDKTGYNASQYSSYKTGYTCNGNSCNSHWSGVSPSCTAKNSALCTSNYTSHEASKT